MLFQNWVTEVLERYLLLSCQTQTLVGASAAGILRAGVFRPADSHDL